MPWCGHGATASRQPTINLTFTVDEGPRVYVERINVRGNTRTRDYVIRREFDIGEGDAYNRALVDRAERRLKNLNYFKSVKITNEPGSAPDRSCSMSMWKRCRPANSRCCGRLLDRRRLDGRVSVSERNLLGHGNTRLAAIRPTRGFELSFAEPFFLGLPPLGRCRLYRQADPGDELHIPTTTSRGTAAAGFALSEELSFQARYTIY